ncbi:MAG: thioesterase family protein [Planctomycetota bacterium]|nr:thioesterase family protein [Planctomycetota bacterium]
MANSPISRIYRHRVDVNRSDIDMMGHVNNVAYVKWMQEAAEAHSTANGWSWNRYHELGAAWVAREHQIRYHSPGFADDRIEVETWVADLKRVSSRRSYRILRLQDQLLLATASTMWAFVDLAKQQPCRVPAEVFSCFEVHDPSENV